MAKDEQKEKNYAAWKEKHGFTTKKGNRNEFDLVYKVRSKYDEAKVNRQNSCYWFAYSENQTNAGAAGGDWVEWWTRQDKAWSMWYQPQSTDGFKSNIKSPMTTGRVEATLHKWKRLNYRWDARPTSREDIGKEKIAKALLDYWFNQGAVREPITTWVKDTLIHGTAFVRVVWKKDVRKYSFPMPAKEIASEKDKETKDEYMKTLEDGKVVWGKAEDYTAFEDIVIEPKPITTIYVDPMARTLHGRNYPARYIVERRLIHIDNFKAEFENDPNAINVDKVKPTSAYSTDQDYEFFQTPHDILDGDLVEILEYENQIDDEYLLVANDILVKHSPLPYNHKQITYHKLDCIEFIHQFYHVGIPDFLMNTQGNQEILMNLIVDYIYRSLNLKMAVDASSFGEFTEEHMRDDSQYIPLDTSDGRPLQSKFQQIPLAPIGFDAYKLYDIMERNATLSSQIDPTQQGLMPANVPATLGVINKEQVELLLGSLADNWANGGLLTVGRQVWALMQQKYAKPFIKKIVGEDGKEKEEERWKTIRLDGTKVIEDKNMISFEKSEDYDFLEIKDKFINTTEEMDVMIAPDSLQVISKGLEMQKSREAYAQLMPNAADPDNSELMRGMEQQGRIPIWNIKRLAKWYAETNDIPEDILLKDEEYEEGCVDEAIEESRKMMAGESIQGIPGRPKAHWMVHVKLERDLTQKIDDLDMAIRKDMEA